MGLDILLLIGCEPHVCENQECDCPDTRLLHPGYVSIHNGPTFKAGMRVAYSDCAGFRFGSYSYFHRQRSPKTPHPALIEPVSDCDGAYSGPFLKELHRQFSEMDTRSESWEEYFELLDSVDDLDTCVLIHC